MQLPVNRLVYVHGRALPMYQPGVVLLQAGIGVPQDVAASKVCPWPSVIVETRSSDMLMQPAPLGPQLASMV